MGKHDGKTEKASPRKKRDARRKGQVAKSAEVGVAMSLIALLLALQTLQGGSIVLARETRFLFSQAPTDALPIDLLRQSTTTVLVAVLVPTVTLAVLAALVSGAGQTGLRLSPEAVKPKLSHLSLKRGLQRFKPSTAAWELTRTVVKLGALALLLWAPMTDMAAQLAASRDLGSGLERTFDQTTGIIGRATALAVVLAGADYAWNRRKHERELKMST
ncbi:MAG: EscU/YscU/HrcU family type III secretion system export apparatus switch protein, partial [Nitriliruptor sp.]|uniref:EscU/YscU/HrcU family type III secretion system export apparatus switch protein n=1 Tax=Nitriliruptor sp. TaxID=2448056 RepID=UPI00349FF673